MVLCLGASFASRSLTIILYSMWVNYTIRESDRLGNSLCPSTCSSHMFSLPMRTWRMDQRYTSHFWAYDSGAGFFTGAWPPIQQAGIASYVWVYGFICHHTMESWGIPASRNPWNNPGNLFGWGSWRLRSATIIAPKLSEQRGRGPFSGFQKETCKFTYINIICLYITTSSQHNVCICRCCLKWSNKCKLQCNQKLKIKAQSFWSYTVYVHQRSPNGISHIPQGVSVSLARCMVAYPPYPSYTLAFSVPLTAPTFDLKNS